MKESMKSFLQNLKEWMWSLLFVLPYIERGKISDRLKYTSGTIVWRAILTIELLLLLILIIRKRYFRRHIIKFENRLIICFSVIITNMVIFGVLNNTLLASVNLGMMLMIPLLNAYLVFDILMQSTLNIQNVIRKSILAYSFFCIFAIIYNVKNLGVVLFLGSSLSNIRLSASGGGTVTLGYTMAFVLSFMLVNSECMRKREVIFCTIVLLMGIILTQDRGAILIIGLDIVYLYLKTDNKTNMLLLGIPTFIVMLVLFIYVIPSVLHRNISLSSLFTDDRFSTVCNSLGIWLKKIWSIPFGFGLNGFFPYQEWLSNVNPEDVYTNIHFNTFYVDGKWLLVQPHSVWVYIIIETGVLGFMTFISVIKGIACDFVKGSKPVCFLLVCMIAFGFLESTLMLEPGVACVWYLMLFYTILYRKNENKKGEV